MLRFPACMSLQMLSDLNSMFDVAGMNLWLWIFYIWNNCGKISTKHDALLPKTDKSSLFQILGSRNITCSKSLDSTPLQ